MAMSSQIATSITVDLDQMPDGLVKLTVVLTDDAGNPLPNKPINLIGMDYWDNQYPIDTVYTDDTGTATYITCIYNIYIAEFPGDEQYAPSNVQVYYDDFLASENFKYVDTTITLSVEPISDTQVTLTATAKDVNGCPVRYEYLHILASNDRRTWSIDYVLTDGSGTIVYTLDKRNIYQVWLPRGAYYPTSYTELQYSTEFTTPVGNALGTTLTTQIEYVSDTQVRLTATLKDVDGNPIPNKYIEIYASNDGILWERIASYLTDSTGTIAEDLPKYNTYRLLFYDPNGNYAYSVAEVVPKIGTKLVLTVREVR